MSEQIDAKLLGLPQTLNDDLLGRAITHQIQIQRYGEGVADQIVNLLEESEADLVAKLRKRLDKIEARGFDLGPATTQRIRDLIVGTGEIVDNRYSKVYGTLKGEMIELAQSEAKYQIGEIEDAVGVNLEMELPAANQLRSIVTAQPFEGAVMSSWAKKLAASEKESIGQAVRLGMAQGETTEQIVRGLTGKGGGIFKSKANARAYARTATNHVSNHARIAVHKENDSLIKGEKMIATLDGRTSPICRFQDGKIYDVGDGPRPPFHYNCRTTVVPVMKSWKELGFNAKELPPSTRASMNGQVPADLTYPDWFKQQPAAFQRELLGPTRYKMFKAGLEDVTRYSNRAGSLYSLDELYKKHPKIAAQAGLIDTDELTGITKAAAVDKMDKHLSSIALTPPKDLTQWKPFKEQLSGVLDVAKANVASAQRAQVSPTKIADYMAEVDNKVTGASKALEAELMKLSAADLKEISKTGKLKLWQWTNKQEMATKLSSINAQELQEVNESVRAKHANWKAQQAINKQKKEAEAKVKQAEEAKKTQVKAEAQKWDTLMTTIVNKQDVDNWSKTKNVLAGAYEEGLDQAAKLGQAGLAGEAGDILKGSAEAIKAKWFELESYYNKFTHKELQELGKGGKIDKWQWGDKYELYTIVTSNNKVELDTIKQSMTKKWQKYKANLKASNDKKKAINADILNKAKSLQGQVKNYGGKILLKDAKALVKDADNIDGSTLSPAVLNALDDLGYKVKSADNLKPPTKAPQAAQDATGIDAAPAQPLTAVDDTADALDIDEEWAKGKQFKLEGDASQLGGAHQKMFYSDADGNKWLFKPAKSNSDGWIAHGEEFVYKIQRVLDPKTPEVRWINLDGQQGSIQRIIDDVDGDFYGVDPKDLSPDDLIAIQREHVLDWLVANHDSHWKQYIRDKNGHIYGIDKGQAFKHFGDDRLDITYHPNAVYGETEPYVNTIWRAFADGTKVEVDPQNALPFIKQVEGINEEFFKDALKPYADGRFGAGSVEAKMFIEGVIERKRNIRKDFEAFYSDLTGSDFAFIDDVAARAAREAADEGATYAGGRLTTREVATVEQEVVKNASQGKSVDFDGDMVEDQNMWMVAEQVGNETHTTASFKLRKDAIAPFEAFLKDNNVSITSSSGRLKEDVFFDDIELAVKNINYHISNGDTNWNVDKLQKAVAHKGELRKLSKETGDVFEMAKRYYKAVVQVENTLLGKNTDKIPNFEAFEPKVAVRPGRADLTVTQGKTSVYKREAKDDGTLEKFDRQPIEQLLEGRGQNIQGGTQWKLAFDDGITIWYDDITTGLKSHRGKIEIEIPQAPSTATLERIMDRLEEMGIDSRIATPEDNELMYLMKQGAAANKDREDSVYKALLKQLDGEAATKETRIRRLKEYWNNELGVKDVTQLPEYQPEGRFELSFKAWADGKEQVEGGRRHYYRFDQTDKDLKGFLNRHTVGGLASQRDDAILALFEDAGFMKKNARMSTTVDKTDIGVYKVGDSPDRDVDSGGADFFFTRIKRNVERERKRNGMYFKVRNLRRMDKVSYDDDYYGDVDRLNLKAGSISDGPRSITEYAKENGNETNYKHGLNIIDELEEIVVSAEETRQRIIDAFKAAGIDELPDGRKIEDVVRSGGVVH